MSKVIIFDLDHTLFDTTAFKRDLFSSLGGLGVPLTVVAAAYKKIMHGPEGFVFDYDIDKHLKEVKRTHELSIEHGRELFMGVLQSAKKYLFPDTEEVLKELKNKGYSLILISRGNVEFNRKKVEYAGLEKYFTKIVITESSKLDVLNTLVELKNNEAEVWMVNDNTDESLKVQQTYPSIRNIVKISEYSKDIEHTKVINSLLELPLFII